MSQRIRVPEGTASEFKAMATVIREMRKLDDQQLARVWEYLWDRYVRHTAP